MLSLDKLATLFERMATKTRHQFLREVCWKMEEKLADPAWANVSTRALDDWLPLEYTDPDEAAEFLISVSLTADILPDKGDVE